MLLPTTSIKSTGWRLLSSQIMGLPMDTFHTSVAHWHVSNFYLMAAAAAGQIYVFHTGTGKASPPPLPPYHPTPLPPASFHTFPAFFPRANALCRLFSRCLRHILQAVAKDYVSSWAHVKEYHNFSPSSPCMHSPESSVWCGSSEHWGPDLSPCREDQEGSRGTISPLMLAI